MRAPLLCLCTLLSLLPAAALAQDDSESGEAGAVDREAGPLRDRIRPVSGHLFLKAGRFELSPAASVSLRDAFFTKFGFGASLTYHFSELLALGVRGAYSLPMVAGSAQICTSTVDSTVDPPRETRSCRPPTYAELDGVAPGQITLLGGVDVQVAPIYGKLSLLGEQFLHFDMYGILGGAGVSYRGPPQNVGEAPRSLLAVGGNVGAGVRVFLNRWITVRGEVRDLIYSEEIVAATGTTAAVYSFRNQLLFELGVSLFIPTTFTEP